MSERREALVLPKSAVRESDQGASVIVVRNGKAERVTVELGIEDERLELVEVKSGLNGGERVIVGAAANVAPGTPIREVGAEHSAANEADGTSLAQRND